MEELRHIGSYTRGSESLGHFLTMFRASFRRHVLLCALVGAVCAALYTADELAYEGRRVLPRAFATEVVGWFSQNGENTGQLARFAPGLGGRRASFVIRQWFVRSFLLALLTFPL